MEEREISHAEFLAKCPNRICDDEFHSAQGVTCVWYAGDETLEEWQPDIGSRRWWITPCAAAE